MLWPVVRKGREAGIGAVTLWPYLMGDFSSFTSSSLRAGGQGCDSQREGKERKCSFSALHVPRDPSGVRAEGVGDGVVKILQEGGRAPLWRRPMERKEEKEYSLLILISAS